MEDEALKKISTILVSIMTLFLLAACGKNAKPETTTKEDTVQKTATKLKVDTKKEKTNALGNALINIKTNAKAEVKITNLKTRKTEVAKADAEGKVVYNVHLGKKVKSIQFEIGSTASGHTASSTIKVTIINNSDAYTEWAANSASTSTDADAVSMDESSSSEESSVDTQSTDQSADTTGVDTTTDAANNTPAGGAATTGTAGNTVAVTTHRLMLEIPLRMLIRRLIIQLPILPLRIPMRLLIMVPMMWQYRLLLKKIRKTNIKNAKQVAGLDP